MGYIIAGLAAAFLAFILLRAAMFRPKKEACVPHEAVEFDREAPINALAQLVRCKTISYNDPAMEDEAEFAKLISLLPGLYPNVFAKCSFQQLPDRALLLRWPGKSSAAPSVMMATTMWCR